MAASWLFAGVKQLVWANNGGVQLLLTRRSPCLAARGLDRYSTEAQNDSTLEPEPEDGEAADDHGEAMLQTKRDISRLPTSLRNRMEHVRVPPTELDVPHAMFYTKGEQRNRLRHRALYARYGRDSGVNPGVMWPSKEELAEILEDERDFEPTLQQRWEESRKRKEAELEALGKFEAKIDANLAKMPTHIENFRKKLLKRGKDKRDAESRQQQLLAEARDHFGFEMHPHDPRVKELKEAKMEAERAKKKAMAKERRAMKIAGVLSDSNKMSKGTS